MGDNLSLVKGTLDMLVLKSLSWTPMHGFEIIEWLEEHSGGSLAVQDGALYHALHRMESRGLVRGEWGMTENNRRARYYTITTEGREWLAEQAAHFVEYAETVTALLRLGSRHA